MFNREISWEQLHNYLQSNYFNGFWGKYKLSISDCVLTQDDSVNCYDNIKEILDVGKSMKLPRSKFYFIDSQNGRINYLGWVTYKRPNRKSEVPCLSTLNQDWLLKNWDSRVAALTKNIKKTGYTKSILCQVLQEPTVGSIRSISVQPRPEHL